MLLSILTAYLTMALTLFLFVEFFRKKRRPKLHIVLGFLTLLFGLLHGLLAGNRAGTALSEAVIGSQLFTLNAGTLCFLLLLLLALSWMLHRFLPKKWLKLHGVLSGAAVTALLCHLLVTGITLPSLLTSATEQAAQSESSASTAEPAITTEESPAAIAKTEQSAAETAVPQEITAAFANVTLTDGVYTGEGQGFRGTVTVQVTVSGGTVTAVSVLSTQDNEPYISRAEAGVIDSVLAEQTLEVDTVSGATYSSQGILQAIYDALEGAVGEGTLAEPEYKEITDPHGRGGPGSH